MKIARYWYRVWMEVPALKKWMVDQQLSSKTWRIPRWGWSANSLEEAKQHAEQRAEKSKKEWGTPNAQFHSVWYETNDYFLMPPREEIVDEIDENGTVVGIITRNRYGVLVLNTDRMLFIDIDHPAAPKRSWKDWILGRKAVAGTALQDREQLILATVAANSQDSYRVYRTFAGWRVVLTSRSIAGVSEEAQQIMNLFPVDPFYFMLCKKQETFRARLTAKPWRIGCNRPDYGFPRSATQDAKFRDWEAAYNAAAVKYRTCELIAGQDSNVANDLRLLLDCHDRICQVPSSLPLG